ncbi:hypothetical protein KBW96_19605, partial [Acinetobacter baumannii]|uniref:hypothetical protein n=1 Tax=Acinetobacter baumannii TaxID=470 RepID=UPI001B377530
VTRLVYANIYSGVVFERGEEPTFMVSILDAEFPEELREFARQPRVVNGENLLAISAGKFRPQVAMAEGRAGASQLSTVLQCARDSNLQLDKLLLGIPAELLVEVYEGRSPAGFRKQLSLRAIRVKYT